MTMSRKLITLALATALFAGGITIPVLAAKSRSVPTQGPIKRPLAAFWKDAKVVEKLALTADQIAALDESLTLTKAALEDTSGSIRSAASALREELKKDAPTLETVYTLQDGLSYATNEKAKIVLSHVVTVKTVLTAEQEEALKKIRRNRALGAAKVLSDLRADIREVIKADGSLEDVQDILESSGLPQDIKDGILARVAKYFETKR